MSNGIDILLITKTPLSLVYIRERGYELNEKKKDESLILYNSAFFTEPYILLIITAVGTAVMLFPYVRLWNEHSALGYLCFRFIEAVFIAIGVVSILGLLSLSSDYGAGHIANEGTYHHIGSVLQSFHAWTFILGPNLMLGLNTLLYSYLLFKTEIVPKRLAVFGMLTAVMVFLAGLTHPNMKFVFLRPEVCRLLPSDSMSTWTPCIKLTTTTAFMVPDSEPIDCTYHLYRAHKKQQASLGSPAGSILSYTLRLTYLKNRIMDNYIALP